MSNTNKCFSERHGYVQPKPSQKKDIDSDLRNGLWNIFYELFPREIIGGFSHNHEIYKTIYSQFLKKPINKYDSNKLPINNERVEKVYINEPFNRVFDLMEFVIQHLRDDGYSNRAEEFSNQCNLILEQENSAYRIVGGLITDIISNPEIETVETALKVPSAKRHLKKALTHFSSRERPDYANSIKESISAVESIAKEITGKEKALNALTQELQLHCNFANGLNELYNWASKTVRHGTSDEPLHINQDSARFMLVICSAFVNYITASSSACRQ